jgi:hypothetical protein
MVARSEAERIGDIALPSPLISGPTKATTLGSDANFFAFVAA